MSRTKKKDIKRSDMCYLILYYTIYAPIADF